MARLIFSVVFGLSCALFACTDHSLKKNVIKSTKHRISSVKNFGDSLKVNQMVIVNNQNVDGFIGDLTTAQPLKISYGLDGIPTFIKSFLTSFSEDGFTIAEPGKDWNCCCERNESRPNRQLIWQGNDGHLFMMSYFTGGIGKTQHLVLISYDNKGINDFWAGMVQDDLKSKAAIVQLLKSHKYQQWASHDRISI
ncbi:MAG: hypothetical protein M3O71_11360 [Bacteroidota bacterium]|nr:hypothetical protein [Bacteroidota bacterium]